MKAFWKIIPAVFAIMILPWSVSAEKQAVLFRVAWNNPFNPSRGEETRLEYTVFDQDSAVRLSVFGADGRLVRNLENQLAQSGVLYTILWDGRNDNGGLVDSGLYFAVLDLGVNGRKVRRLVVRRQ